MQWTALLCAFLVAEAATLGVAGRHGDFTVPGAAFQFVALMGAAGCLYLLALAAFRQVQRRAFFFWVAAIAFRLAIFPCAPADDFWRYLWEGKVQLHGVNPYLHAPDSPDLMPLRDPQWERINHRHSAAVYPPGAELLFRALAAVGPSVVFFKAIFAIADLATIFLLLQLIRGPTGERLRSGRSHAVELTVNDGTPVADRCAYRVAAWYAWNPAVAYASAGAGHYDSVMLFAMTAALLALDRGGKVISTARATGSAAWLGVAVALKIVPLFLLPAWICALRRRSFPLVLAFAIPAALCFFYGGIAIVLRPLHQFAEVTRFHDLVWWFIEALTIPNPFGRNWPFTVAIVIAASSAAWKLRNDWRRCAFWVFGLVLLLSPVLHPWYVLWILPLAIWRHAYPWAVLAVSSLGALLLWEDGPFWRAWEPNLFTRGIVIVPAVAAWIWQRTLENRARP